MSNISDYLKEDLIFPELTATSKEEAIAFLLKGVYATRSRVSGQISQADGLKKILERERLQSTALGEGIAFPHARIEGWNEFVLAVGISPQGIDFHAPDKRKVHIVCLMVSSLDEPYTILQAMSALSRFFIEQHVSERIQSAGFRGWEDIQQLLLSRINITGKILARDIMRPVLVRAKLDMHIQDATRLMHAHKMDVLPVVDANNKLVGEVTCQDILRLELPDFFQNMTTISFIRHIDPFEQYFKDKKNLLLKEALIRKVTPIKPAHTLIEVIFLLSVKNFSKLYVVDESQRLIGIIDRFTIIDKVLFL
ncbi:MAG: PTS sugar transporter subunit IIA [Candidatus Omnitrophica bacterium]|nr:PTS sugar transporter subunit IIA [Candidatus Omnitrophota bacterium]